ncbi:MAG: phosphatidylglycerophosphatase A [Desulfovibrio sp.]
MRYSLKDEFILAFCRLGVAGLSPKAPGTCGTALACLLAPFLFGPLDYLWRCIILVVLFVLGGFAATRAERLLHQKDPGQVVIDELVGVWLVILPFVKPGFWVISSAFVLFRVFDIIKPWPVSASENWLPNGFGVMIDDVMAGILALPFMGLLYWTGIF